MPEFRIAHPSWVLVRASHRNGLFLKPQSLKFDPSFRHNPECFRGNRADIDFMNGYARSPSTVFVSEDTIRRGWQTVRDRYKKKYPSRAKMGTLKFSDLEITPLSSDWAVAIGRW